MSGSDLAVAAVAVACFCSLWWCLLLTHRLRRIERTRKLGPVTGLGSEDCGILAGHGLVTAPASDIADSRPNPPPSALALPGASVQPTADGVPVQIDEVATTLPLTPSAIAALDNESAGGPGAVDDSAELLRTDGERMRCKREAVGWTRRQVSVVCQESEETIKDIELARSVVAKDIRAKIEACLDAELAQQGLPSKKL